MCGAVLAAQFPSPGVSLHSVRTQIQFASAVPPSRPAVHPDEYRLLGRQRGIRRRHIRIAGTERGDAGSETGTIIDGVCELRSKSVYR